MLEHFCYIWLGQGGEKDIPLDDDRALDALATVWVKAIYWRRSSRGLPETVTRPGLLGCLYCRSLPLWRSRYHPSLPISWSISQTPSRRPVWQWCPTLPSCHSAGLGTARVWICYGSDVVGRQARLSGISAVQRARPAGFEPPVKQAQVDTAAAAAALVAWAAAGRHRPRSCAPELSCQGVTARTSPSRDSRR
jgi:hypothetical protein